MGWARAFYAFGLGLKPGDRLLTGVVEYAANYVAMLQVRWGFCRRTPEEAFWGIPDTRPLVISIHFFLLLLFFFASLGPRYR